MNADPRPDNSTYLTPLVSESPALRWLCPLLIVLLTVAAFAPALGNDFVNWDDRQNLVDNDAYRGLSAESIAWMFTTFHGGHYQPLSWLTFAVDHALWGLDPRGFHLTNLILHVLAAMCVYVLTFQLLRIVWPDESENGLRIAAAVCALLFAVHPLRVESVAWATERRDVLSGSLLLAALVTYVAAVRSEQHRRYQVLMALSWAGYCLSLLAKAGGLVFPVVLLILDVYPLRRLSGARQSPWRSVSKVLTEKIVFVVPALLAAWLAWHAQRDAGAMWTLDAHPMPLRIGQAFYGVLFYVWKTLWPVGLIPLYEQRPDATPLDIPNIIGALFFVMVSLFCWRTRRRWPGLSAAWLVYQVVLLPVLGLAQSGPQVVADRYSYLSCIPWAVLAGAGVLLVRRARFDRPALCRLLPGLVVMIVGVLILATRQQTLVWSNSFTLWRTVLHHAPDTGLAHANLAAVLNEHGDHETALHHARRAAARLPGNRVARIAMGQAASGLGDHATAAESFRVALRIADSLGRQDTATMLLLAGEEARQGNMVAAEEILQTAAELEPEVPEWPLNIGGLLTAQGRHREAVESFEHAIRLNHDLGIAYDRLATVWLILDEPRRAMRTLEAGVERMPENVDLLSGLAWILATSADAELRNGDRAMALARRAVSLPGGDASIRAGEALAAALAEQGAFSEALDEVRRLRTEVSSGQVRRIARLSAMEAAFADGRPYREAGAGMIP